MDHGKPTHANLKKVIGKEFEPEPYDRYIVRHISIFFTWFLVRTPITANQVTLLQEIVGVAGAILIGFGEGLWGSPVATRIPT